MSQASNPSETLKPCPFCGSEKVLSRYDSEHYVDCDEPVCLAAGPIAKTEQEAIAKWNAAPRTRRTEVVEVGKG